ncbi:MAG: methyltransferase domain-containing protein [Magnetococcales bacterium]|nr:methyltransferase domain-containing protein [Magnetococcales bacterium]
MSVQLDFALKDIGIDIPLVTGLHCGSGAAWKQNWLNTDAETFTGSNGVQTKPVSLFTPDGYAHTNFYYLQHDATTPFPIPDNLFDHCYAEHFIEHLNRDQGLAFLQEVHRMLRPGGILRLSTPDLHANLELFFHTERPAFAQSVAFLEGRVPAWHVRNRAFMVNQLFYFWGHQWIYDFEDLALLLEQAGFPAASIERRAFREGNIAEVEQLDQEARSQENLFVEAVKAP